jgi:hypothetical protein
MMVIVFGKFFWAAGAKMVTSHKVTIFVPHCNSTSWNTGSARNLILTITFIKQRERLCTGRSLLVCARLTAWRGRHFICYLLDGCILQVVGTMNSNVTRGLGPFARCLVRGLLSRAKILCL